MRSRQQQKAIFAHLNSKGMMDHLKGSIKIKQPKSRFSWDTAFEPSNSTIIADSYRVDKYGNPAGQIGIGPGMGIVGDPNPPAFVAMSKRPKRGD